MGEMISVDACRLIPMQCPCTARTNSVHTVELYLLWNPTNICDSHPLSTPSTSPYDLSTLVKSNITSIAARLFRCLYNPAKRGTCFFRWSPSRPPHASITACVCPQLLLVLLCVSVTTCKISQHTSASATHIFHWSPLPPLHASATTSI